MRGMKGLSRLIGAAFFFVGWMQAAPPRTPIRDVVYLADGSKFDGKVTIEWATFTASDQSVMPGGRVTLPVINGVLQIDLMPTTDASLGASYGVRYVSGRNTVYAERWYVPPSASPVPLRVVRAQVAGVQGPGGLTQVAISDVTGLEGELAARPVKGAGYQPNRVLRANGTGQVEAVSGNATDCVKVDGTSGACGSAGGGSATFNGQAASNVIIGDDLDWIDQGNGTYRVQVGATIARTSLGSGAPSGACTPGYVYVTATQMYYCDANSAWREAGTGTASSTTGVFAATGWTARNSSNVTWARSTDGSAVIATIGATDQDSLAVYCRAHSGVKTYRADVLGLRGTAQTGFAAGVVIRSSGYRGVFLGYGSIAGQYDVSGYTFDEATYGLTGNTAAGQGPWHMGEITLGMEDTGSNLVSWGKWQRGSESRGTPSEVCLGVQGKANTQVAFYNWRE